MPKKLKKVIKSLYSHEIRKDVCLASLRSLKLQDAWPFIREDIEREVGSAYDTRLICIPHLTEPHLYFPGSLFLMDGEMVVPLGSLSTLVDRSACASDLLSLLDKPTLPDLSFHYPHDSIKITLQDEAEKNKVRVILSHVTRELLPELLLHPRAPLPLLPHPSLSAGCSLVVVRSALCVGTLEFRVTRASSSRIFHLGQRTPLLLDLCAARLAPDNTIVPQAAALPEPGLQWRTLSGADSLSAPRLDTHTL